MVVHFLRTAQTGTVAAWAGQLFCPNRVQARSHRAGLLRVPVLHCSSAGAGLQVICRRVNLLAEELPDLRNDEIPVESGYMRTDENL